MKNRFLSVDYYLRPIITGKERADKIHRPGAKILKVYKQLTEEDAMNLIKMPDTRESLMRWNASLRNIATIVRNHTSGDFNKMWARVALYLPRWGSGEFELHVGAREPWRWLHEARVARVHTFTNGWAGGGFTVSRRTANKKLTKLYWPSRKRSPKRLIVLSEQKSGGARQKIVSSASRRIGAPTFKLVPAPLLGITGSGGQLTP